MASRTLKDGTVVDNVPDSVTDAQLEDAVLKLAAPKPSVQEDVGKSLAGSLRNGLVEAATFPGKAALGLAGAGADALGWKAAQDAVGKTVGNMENLDQTLKQAPGTGYLPVQARSFPDVLKSLQQKPVEGPSFSDYAPQTEPGKWASALGGGAAAALPGGQAGALARALVGASSGGFAELGARNGGPLASLAGSVLPNLLMAGKNVAVPDQALATIKKAATAVPGELEAALATMQNAKVPLLPGQAFGPNHQMEGIQEAITKAPATATPMQAALRQQTAAMDAATGKSMTSNDPNLPQYKQDYNAAAQTPVAPSEALKLAVALSRARSAGNLVGEDLTKTGALASLPIKIDPSRTARIPAQLGDYKDTRGGPDRFHGTSSPIGSLNDDYALNGDSRNIFGQGFYTTDSASTAAGYMKKGKGSDPTMYKVTESGAVPLLDMEAKITPDISTSVRKVTDHFLHDNGEMLNNSKNLRDFYNEFRAESQNAGLSRADVQEAFDGIRYNLEAQGYKGFSHLGGVKGEDTAAAHRVNIYWSPEKDLAISPVNTDNYRDILQQSRAQPNSATNLGQVQNIRDQLTALQDNSTGGLRKTVGKMKDTVSGFLRTKDGRFATSDATFSDLMENQAKTQLARGGQGASGLPVVGNSNAAVVGARAGVFGPLALIPAVKEHIASQQAKDLADVFLDPTGKKLVAATKYSPQDNAMAELARALLQSRVAQQAGSGQGVE